MFTLRLEASYGPSCSLQVALCHRYDLEGAFRPWVAVVNNVTRAKVTAALPSPVTVRRRILAVTLHAPTATGPLTLGTK